MADVYLNLLYNDNGATTSVRELVENMHRLEGYTYNVGSGLRVLSSMLRSVNEVAKLPSMLNGISQVKSYLNQIVSMPLSGITDSLVKGLSTAVERYDELRTFPQVMQSIGYNTSVAATSTARLRDSIIGLPTALNEIVSMAKQLTLLTGNLELGTEAAIGLNNLFVASGASAEQMTTGLKQIYVLLEGGTPNARQWQSLIRTIPIGVRLAGEELGYKKFTDFTAALRGNAIAGEEVVNALIKIGNTSPEITKIIDVYKNTISAATENLKIAGQRAGEAVLTGLEDALALSGNVGISPTIKRLSSLVDNIGAALGDYLRKNSTKIGDLVDKFFSIDWVEVLTGAVDGFLDVLDRLISRLQTVSSIFGEFSFGRYLTMIDTLSSDISKIASGIETIGNALQSITLAYAAVSMLSQSPNNPLIPMLGGNGGTFSSLLTVASRIYGAIVVVREIYDVLSLIDSKLNDIYYAIEETKEENEKIVSGGRRGLTTALMGSDPAVASTAFLNYLSSNAKAYSAYSSILDQAFSTKNLSWYNPNNPNAVIYGRDILNVEDLSGYVSSANINQNNSDAVLSLIKEMRKFGLTSRAVELSETFSSILDDVNFSGFTDDLSKEFNRLLSLFTYVNEGGYEIQDEWITSLDQIITETKAFSIIQETYNMKMENVTKELDKLLELQEEINKKVLAAFSDWTSLGDLKSMYEKGEIPVLTGESAESGSFVLGRNTRKQEAEYEHGMSQKRSEFIRLAREHLEELYPDLSDEERSAVMDQVVKDANAASEKSLNRLIANNGEYLRADEGGIDYIEQLVETGKQKADDARAELEAQYGDVDKLVEDKETELAALVDASLEATGNAATIIEEAVKVLESTVRQYMLDEGKVIPTDILGILATNMYAADFSGITGAADYLYGRVVSIIQDKFSSPIHVVGGNVVVDVTPDENEEFTRQWWRSASGGKIPTFGTDTVPTMLTPGEYVHRRAVVQHYGKAFMDRINNLDLQGALATLSMSYVTPFATGGLVRSDNRSYRDNHASIVQNFNNSRSDYSFRRANRFVRGLA